MQSNTFSFYDRIINSDLPLNFLYSLKNLAYSPHFEMKILKKTLKRLLIFLSVAVLFFTAYITYFLHKNDAPVTNGKVEFHIPYSSSQTLDIYYPTIENDLKPAPVLMYIHGGAWIAGSKLTVNNNRFNQAFNALRAQGYFIVSPDYTLAKDGQTPFPDCIQDVFEATQWVSDNADKYNWDMNQFGLLGESAGAHLAMMVAFGDASDFGLENAGPQIDYLIDVYGPSDLNALYNASSTDSINAMIRKLPAVIADRFDLSKMLVGFDPRTHPDSARSLMEKLSPLTYLDREKIPTLVIHGKKDQIVPIDQSLSLTKKMDSLGISYSAHYFEGVNHAFQGATQAQKDSIQSLIVNFITSNRSHP